MSYHAAKAEVEIELSPLVAKSQAISRTDPAESISVVLVLPLKDPNGAAEFVQHVSTPLDQLYGKYLTPQQFADRFGANESDYQTAKQWAIDSGLTISEESVSRTTLTVHGTVEQFEQLFNTQMNNYRSPDGKEFYSASAQPIAPKVISSLLASVVGLSEARPETRNTKLTSPVAKSKSGMAPDVIFSGGSGPGNGFTAADIQGAYAIPPYLGSAKPQTVAAFEISGAAPGDIATFLAYNNLPNVPVTVRSVDGFNGEILYPYENQTVADADMLIGTNPALKEVLIYGSGGINILVSLLNVLSAVASDNKAETLDVSWFIQESDLTKSQVKAEAEQFTQLAAQGITVVAAAGDAEAVGNNPQFNLVCDPATQPLVTGVGGTGLSIGNQGPFQATYISEEVWNTVLAGVDYATAGGVSFYWPIPSWQPPAAMTYNGGSAKKRNVPDVAAVGSTGTPVAIYYSTTGWSLVGGTSISSAVWAGFISIMNSARETAGLGPIGFFNPTLYNMITLYGNPGLNDITYGYNADPLPPYSRGHFAGPGYDNCSGWGSMYGTYFAAELLLTPTKQGTKPGPFGGLSGSSGHTTANLTWAKSAGATGYLVIVNAPGHGPLFFDYISKDPKVEVTGLTPGIIFEATVTALNSSGTTNCDTVIYLDPQ